MILISLQVRSKLLELQLMILNSRYLEVASEMGPPMIKTHIQGILFDRIMKRNSFLNSSLDVNENRFKAQKEPKIWSKNKRVSNVTLTRGSKSGYIQNLIKQVLSLKTQAKCEDLHRWFKLQSKQRTNNAENIYNDSTV